MQFKIKKKERPTEKKYHKSDIDVAYDFSKRIYREMGDFLKCVILFGTVSRKTYNTPGDIDILIIIDDVSVYLTPELLEAYRVISARTSQETSKKLHITTMRLTSFWEYVKAGDPIAINMLRDGLALIDTGFFDPLQLLLFQGRIRPTAESIWTYFTLAPQTLSNSKWHLLQATIDLYWAVIDAAHAALMKAGEIPPSPDHVADILEEKLVKKKLIEQKYVTILRNFYKLMKMITHREIKEVRGEEYEKYYSEAHAFVNRMRDYINHRQKA